MEYLQRAQDIGAVGAASLELTVQHARSFVAALPAGITNVCDIGSGAGIPGLVIALDRPELSVTLVDRRAKRTDEVLRIVTSLGWSTRVQVECADVSQLSRQSAWHGRFDAVVARGFGPPQVTLRSALPLVRTGGVIVLSEPPDNQPSRWTAPLLASVGLAAPVREGQVAVFHVEHPTGAQRS